VSEGGLELLRTGAHRGTSRSIDTHPEQALRPGGRHLRASGYIRVHGRQYHAKYHAVRHPMITLALAGVLLATIVATLAVVGH
jgi:hypothetical protein